jgi:hypothetical protein
MYSRDPNLNNALSMPEPRHSLGNANVICLKRVQSHTERDCSDTESPHGNLSGRGNALYGEIIDDA